MPRSVSLGDTTLVLSKHARKRAEERGVQLDALVRLAKQIKALIKAAVTTTSHTFKASWKGVTAVFAPKGQQLVVITCWAD